jgi:hypothetical protein
MRGFDGGPWKRVCDVPCDRRLLVDGAELRVDADGMPASNPFRIEPGIGTARFRVSSGSDTSRTIGLGSLLVGIPVSLGGMFLYGYGKIKDEQGMETAGIVTLAVGGVLVLGSLPFLAMGRTGVRDSRGRTIAHRSWELPRF